ncbi:SHOCT domain-containing protein [Streptomyces sp. NBC_01351]|uniref:SHOCT domain-containing protein n=1 Tax=Streptomyces sp. NBC_01351 TaxID=2903833 RepID=UPI002E354ABE|nr:SHOCT domain-containing protein [Streptomyces sp. NBC_01351]
MGRPGLLGTMARTAVVAGTATAVSGRMQRSAAQRAEREQLAAEARQQQLLDQTAARSAPPAPAPVAAPVAAAPASDRITQLTQLSELKAQGVLTEEEFAAEKARILGSW